MSNRKELSAEQREALLEVLRARFDANQNRHKGVRWADVRTRLEASPAKLRSLQEMEITGGEPDVVSLDIKTGDYVFVDCSPETPEGRRSVCYDREALDARKEHKPKTSAMEMAAAMGIEMLTEEEYLALQRVGEFDSKTSSWLRTPKAMRELGGALFGDLRYGRVFVYQNGASSYYRVRGFRGSLQV